MKTYFISLAALFLGILNCSAQAFHYDTVPNPKTNQQPERQLYTVEQPAQQSSKQTSISTQETPSQSTGFDKGRLVLGGAIGMSFGSNYTAVSISPQIGYAFNPYFTAGGGLSYFYYSGDYYNGFKTSSYSQNYLGLNVYARANPIKFIALQIQPEIYQMWGKVGGESISKTVPCVLAGGGITVPAGRGGINAMIYYDLVQDDYSPYGDQLFYSLGYVFSF